MNQLNALSNRVDYYGQKDKNLRNSTAMQPDSEVLEFTEKLTGSGQLVVAWRKSEYPTVELATSVSNHLAVQNKISEFARMGAASLLSSLKAIGNEAAAVSEQLDFTVSSFENLDKAVEYASTFIDYITDTKIAEEKLRLFEEQLGCYIAEVIRRNHQGRWLVHDDPNCTEYCFAETKYCVSAHPWAWGINYLNFTGYPIVQKYRQLTKLIKNSRYVPDVLLHGGMETAGKRNLH